MRAAEMGPNSNERASGPDRRARSAEINASSASIAGLRWTMNSRAPPRVAQRERAGALRPDFGTERCGVVERARKVPQRRDGLGRKGTLLRSAAGVVPGGAVLGARGTVLVAGARAAVARTEGVAASIVIVERPGWRHGGRIMPSGSRSEVSIGADRSRRRQRRGSTAGTIAPGRVRDPTPCASGGRSARPASLQSKSRVLDRGCC